jgi:Dyp-type peroxidase family
VTRAQRPGAETRTQLAALYATGLGPPGVSSARAAVVAADASPAALLRPHAALPRAVAAPPALSPSQGVAPADSPLEPVVDVHDIQGNVLVGFNKDFQAFLFFQLTDVAVAKRWVRQITPGIATVAETLAFRRLYRAMRARALAEPEGMVATWINIAFTNSGVQKLTSPAELDAFTDLAFKVGMAERASLLGDPVDTAGHPTGWKVGAGNRYPDLVLIVASDRQDILREKVRTLLADIEALQGASPRRPNPGGLWLVYEQLGADLGGGLKGHEHFGFKDGISHPGPRGRVSDAPEDFLTPRLIDPSEPIARTHAWPGQPLIWPGQFVLGAEYPRQNFDDAARPGPNVSPQPGWSRNGSYLVFRRIRQDVPMFWSFMDAEASRLAQSPHFAGMTAIRLASLCVGRWPSGAPVMRTPLQDDPRVAANDVAVNNFNFSNTTAPVRMRPGSGSRPDDFPPIDGDGAGLVCPFAAHIRKVNPRDDRTDIGADQVTLAKLVLRRGIPYGPPMDDPLRPQPDRTDRGLLFVSYQSSIEEQFEFLQIHWTNSDRNPNSFESGTGGAQPAGHDPIIGQAGAAPGRTRVFTLGRGDGTFEVLALPSEWVRVTGGGYFFSPSISALRDVLSA